FSQHVLGSARCEGADLMKRAPRVFVVTTGLMLFAVSASAQTAGTLADLLSELIARGAVMAQPVRLDNFTTPDTTRPDLSTSFVPNLTLTTVPTSLAATLALQLST